MKKLLFTFVGAASFAALAADPAVGDNITVLGFENFQTTDVGVVNKDDSGGNDTSYWSVPAGAEDNSLVKAYGVGENATAPTGISFPAPFTDAGNNYLALDTNGSELQRAIPAAGQTIGASGIYVDTLVQFTPSESAPSVETDLVGAKLAIWLGVDTTVTPNTTNLYVQGAYYDSADGESLTVEQTKAYKLNKSCEPGTWYRLTVKAYQTIGNASAVSDNINLPAFSILIDGEEIATSDAVYSQAGLYYLCPGENTGVGSADDNYLDSDMLTLFKGGKIIPSCDMSRVAATLTAVGFKGTGAIDDFVVTTEAPDFTPPAGDDYVVSIDGSDVVVTPSAEDLAAVQAAVVAGGGTLDVTDVAAVNAAMAAEIGSTGVPSWQAIFLGLPPTEAGLESFKIDSISFDASGNVVVELPDDVDPKTGRGVDITIKLMGSTDLSTWTQIETAGGEDNKTFAPVTPGSGETKKFYKVVVEFAGSSD